MTFLKDSVISGRSWLTRLEGKKSEKNLTFFVDTGYIEAVHFCKNVPFWPFFFPCRAEARPEWAEAYLFYNKINKKSFSFFTRFALVFTRLTSTNTR